MASKLASPVLADHKNQLKSQDLAELLKSLNKHGYSGTSYYNLGLYLGLSSATMDIIAKDNKNVESCLRECLKEWLRKADDVLKKGGPTIYSLVSALRELGENGVAEGILEMEKHPACRILACYMSNQSLVAALPQLAALLHSEKLIKELICIKKEEETCLSEIAKAVCMDSNKLEMFAAILIKKTATMEIGNMIMREYRKVYHHDESNAKKDEVYFPPFLASMRMKLGSVFAKVELIIEASTLKKIKNKLKQYCEDLKPQIAQCGNIHDILELVRKDCSLDDIDLLKAIVNGLNIEEAKAVIQEYSDAIKEFSKTELRNCLHERFSDASPLQCESITIVVDRNTDDCTLHDVRKLSANIFRKLSPHSSRHVKLFVIRSRDKNSFTITYFFPLILSEQLIAAALNNIDVLKESKVKRLTIGYFTVYEVIEIVDRATSTPNTIDSYEHSSGLFKQLMLSLSVQLINSKEEVYTLNEVHNFELMEFKNKMQKKENEISRQQSEIEQLMHKRENETDGVTNAVKQSLPLSSDQSAQLEDNSASLYEPKAEIQMHLKAESKEQIMQDKMSQMGEEMKAIIQEKMQIIKANLREKEEMKTEIETLQAKLVRQVDFERQEFLEFEDDIYGFVEIDHPLLIKIVRAEQFTRLKEIKTLGYISHNMPKATYSRHEQSIGMYYFAGKFVKKLKKRQPKLNITNSDVLCVQIAALCYNLGHGPFSRIFEDFLKEIKASRRYWNDLPANVMMFQHMIEANRLPFDEYLDNPEDDIEFIKELMTGKKGPQAVLREDKVFLYEIVVNKMSGLDVNRIDYAMRDAVVLGKRIHFNWRKFLNRIRVEMCSDGMKHICANQEDLDLYNGLFTDCHTLFRELYFERKNRIVATMVNRILIKCGKAELIRGPDGKKLSLIDAIKSMDTYSRLNDGIISVIKETVVDPEVVKLIKFLGSSKLFIPIGYVKNCQLNGGPQQLKEEIIENEKGLRKDDIIVDVAESGYERAKDEIMYYISSNGTVQKWTNAEWQPIPAETFPAPWRVFYTKHNNELVAKMKSGLRKVVDDIGGQAFIYENVTDMDLIPEEDPASPQ